MEILRIYLEELLLSSVVIVLLDEAFNIAKSPKYDGYKRGLTSMIYNFYDKKPTLLARSETLATRGKSVSGGGVKKKLCQVGVLWT